MEKVKDYFKRYPLSPEVYENGGVLFHNRGAADSHGAEETKKYTRKQVCAKAEVVVTSNELTIEADLDSLKYDDLKKLAASLSLSVEDSKKETLLKALTEFKESLKAK